MTILLLLFLSANAADMPYADTDFSCITNTKAQQFVNDFSIDTTSFGGMELCNSQIDTKKLFNDLQIVEEGAFTNQGQNKLVRGFINANQYYSWVKGETRGISRGNDIPYATAYNSWGYFTMQDGWAALSTLGRVGTLIHEARHTAGYRHFPCNQGPYEGASLSGCDRNYDQAGSHAIEMEYYARVSTQGTNFHPVYRSMARLMAMARANMVFNTPILKKKEALLALDDQAYLFQNGEWIARETPAFEGDLKRTSAGAVLFNGTQARSIELYEQTGFKPEIKDDYSYYKLLVQTSGQLLDFEEFDLGTRRYVATVDEQNRLAMFDFPRGDWSSSVTAPNKVARFSTLLENGEDGFFVVFEDGRIKDFDPSRKRFGSDKKFHWGSHIVSLARVDKKLLSLQTDGLIYEQNQNQWIPWTPAQGRQFKQMVNVPLYDAFEVVK